MTGRRPRPRGVGVAALVLLAVGACSSDDRIGTLEDFCDDQVELQQALSGLAEGLAAGGDTGPDDLGEVRDRLRGVRAPEDLRQALDRLAGALDEVVAGLSDRDLRDPDQLAAFQDRLTGLEVAAPELEAAAQRVASAIEDCGPPD